MKESARVSQPADWFFAAFRGLHPARWFLSLVGVRARQDRVGTALSASIFWSLETLVYLHLRASIDAVDASEIASESEKSEEPLPPPDTTETIKETPAAPPKSLTSRLWQLVQIMSLVVGSWCLMVWLFQQVGGEDSGWLAWGLGDQFRPPAAGYFRIASNIAAFWAVVWIGGSFYTTLRGWFRRGSGSKAAPAAESAGLEGGVS